MMPYGKSLRCSSKHTVYIGNHSGRIYMDLRDFISMCEMAGQLKGLKTEVNWDLEISHVLRAETRGGKSRPCAALIY
jgi:hypothetical protein